LIKSIILSIVQ